MGSNEQEQVRLAQGFALGMFVGMIKRLVEELKAQRQELAELRDRVEALEAKLNQ